MGFVPDPSVYAYLGLDEGATYALKVSLENKYPSGNGILNENGRAYYLVEPLTTPASSN